MDETNLQRQVLYSTADVGRPKLDVRRRAHSRAQSRMSTSQRTTSRFQSRNARRSSTAYDVVVDGTDNFPTRYLVNDACVMTGTPNVYGSVLRSSKGKPRCSQPPAGRAIAVCIPSRRPKG